MVIGENWILVSSVLKLTSIASTPSIGFDVIVTVISSVDVGLARLSSYITSPVCTEQKKSCVAGTPQKITFPLLYSVNGRVSFL